MLPPMPMLKFHCAVARPGNAPHFQAFLHLSCKQLPSCATSSSNLQGPAWFSSSGLPKSTFKCSCCKKHSTWALSSKWKRKITLLYCSSAAVGT